MSDFWTRNEELAARGFEKLGVGKPSFSVQTATKILNNLIDYRPVLVRWRGVDISAGLVSVDGGWTLEVGGGQPGDKVTLIFSASKFTDELISEKDDIALTAWNGDMICFQVQSSSLVFLGGDQSFTVTAEVIGDE